MPRAKREHAMLVVCVASSKGGSGKSTLAAALAVRAAADGDCVVLDCDPQCSLLRWWDLRGKTDNPVVREPRGDLTKILPDLAKEGFDTCIIDTPPAPIDKIESAIKVADVVLIPAQASVLDVESVGATVELARKHGRKFVFVLNRVEPRSKLTAEAEAYLQADGPVLSVRVKNRESYRAAMTDGRTGPEVRDESAKNEINELWLGVTNAAIVPEGER